MTGFLDVYASDSIEHFTPAGETQNTTLRAQWTYSWKLGGHVSWPLSGLTMRERIAPQGSWFNLALNEPSSKKTIHWRLYQWLWGEVIHSFLVIPTNRGNKKENGNMSSELWRKSFIMILYYLWMEKQYCRGYVTNHWKNHPNPWVNKRSSS